jgi:hypothetical protein
VPTREPIVNGAGEIRNEPLYDVGEVAGLIGTSPRTVRRRVNAGLWPHIRGKRDRLLFTAEHVRLIVAAFNTAHDYPAHEPGKLK